MAKRKIFRGLLVMLYLPLFLIVGGAGCSSEGNDNGPSDNQVIEYWPKMPGPYHELAKKSVDLYKEQNRSYKKLLSGSEYDPFGDFLNFGRDAKHAGLPKDPNGIVTSSTDPPRYNPVTIAQYSLTLYGQYLKGEATKYPFLHQADFLISMIESDGSVRYYFDYQYYCMPDEYFKSGWTSSMAIGHVLSVCARAYHISKDEKYADAANKALSFMKVHVKDDGVMSSLEYLDPSLSNYMTYEEYPTIPATYTLNGFMYTLIGLYDWSCVNAHSSVLAKECFDEGIKTLQHILPYYDIGGFTSYDLAHITLNRDLPLVNVKYHMEHVAFCKIFYDITGSEVFNQYYKLWASYVD